MNVEVPQPETFEGGAEIMQNPDGGATIQALMGEEGIMVQVNSMIIMQTCRSFR